MELTWEPLFKMATEHCLKSHGQLNWLHPEALSREARYQSRKISKSQEIERSKCGSSKSNINRDDGNFLKTNTWTLLLRNINNLESALRNQKSHCKADMTSDQHLYINGSCILSICLKTTATNGVEVSRK